MLANKEYIFAETSRMFLMILARAGGVNRFGHRRELSPISDQTVVRMNRDTLYSSAIVDVAGGAQIKLPETEGRYLSAVVIDAHHYVVDVFHGPGPHHLSSGESGDRHVAVLVRTYVNPELPGDVALANGLQDQISVEAGSSVEYRPPEFDEDRRRISAQALAKAGQDISDTRQMFGRKGEVDHHHHAVGAAVGWGGLPESEALYIFDSTPRSAAEFRLEVPSVEVDAFWSVTVYNRDGYLEANARNVYGVNSLSRSGLRRDNIDVIFSPDLSQEADVVPVMDGWNYVLRLYQPRKDTLARVEWPEPRLLQ